VHAVPPALEFEDLLPAGRRASDPQREKRGFRPGARVVNLIGARDRLDEALREANRRFVQEVVRRPLCHLALHGLDALRVPVSEQCGTRTEMEINELTPVHVGNMSGVTFGYDEINFGRQHEEPEPSGREILVRTFQQVSLTCELFALRSY